ncbi:MAG: VWA domain-containing protein [Pirellulales bacterium]
MNFMHFWAIGIGAIAVAAPVAVHFLTKPKPSPFPLSTLRFLREAIEQRRARSRFRDLLILLLRSLAVALLAAAIARPLINQPAAVEASGAVDTSRVIIVDVSRSMSAGVSGSSSLSRARVAALRYLDNVPGMDANVIFAGAKARSVFDRLSPNFPSLRESVRQVEARAERADARAAIEEAAKLLSSSKSTAREVVLISDFQRSNWGTLPVDLLPEGTRVQMHSVSQGELDNVAVTSVRTGSQPSVGKEVNVEVDVANYSEREASVRCRIVCGDLERTLEGKVSAGGIQTLSTKATFNTTGWQWGWVKLESNLDALPEDDVRPCAWFVRPAPKILLVTRQPAQEKPSSSYYLEQAIKYCFHSEPSTQRSDAVDANTPTPTTVSVNRVAPQRTVASAWPEADVIVLDHPGSLPKETLQVIASRVRRGKGLLVVTSELVDGVNLQALSELWGKSFQPPVTLMPDTKNSRKDLFVTRFDQRRPPFAILGSNTAALKPVRFAGGLATQAVSEGLRDQVLAELSDSSTLLYMTGVDAGQITVLNADLGQSNWCVQPTFLPVLGEVMANLLSGRKQASETDCGEPLVRLLPTDVTAETKLKLSVADEHSSPAGESGKWEWSASQAAMVWSWPDPPGPGLYRLHNGDETVWAVATAAPAAEADLQVLDKEVLTERIATGRQAAFSLEDAENDGGDNMWNWLVIACAVGLIAEILTLRWVRS